MSTRINEEPTLESALASIPATFRTRLLKYYRELKDAFSRGSFDACGSRAGKFSETLIRYIQELLCGSHTPFGQQVNIFVESRRLEGLPATTGPEPFRIFIPRALCFLYTLRNKRGFAHVGGDLDSDPIDASTCVRVADWCLCELIRVVHNLPLEEAQALLNCVSTREMADVWHVGGKKRVLRDGLDFKSQVLLLLYSELHEAVLIEDLLEWTEYSRFDDFKRHILTPLHRGRLIEWDKETNAATISPKGIEMVEALLTPKGAIRRSK
jgi:hypothetical protein